MAGPPRFRSRQYTMETVTADQVIEELLRRLQVANVAAADIDIVAADLAHGTTSAELIKHRSVLSRLTLGCSNGVDDIRRWELDRMQKALAIDEPSSNTNRTLLALSSNTPDAPTPTPTPVKDVTKSAPDRQGAQRAAHIVGPRRMPGPPRSSHSPENLQKNGHVAARPEDQHPRAIHAWLELVGVPNPQSTPDAPKHLPSPQQAQNSAAKRADLGGRRDSGNESSGQDIPQASEMPSATDQERNIETASVTDQERTIRFPFAGQTRSHEVPRPATYVDEIQQRRRPSASDGSTMSKLKSLQVEAQQEARKGGKRLQSSR